MRNKMVARQQLTDGRAEILPGRYRVALILGLSLLFWATLLAGALAEL